MSDTITPEEYEIAAKVADAEGDYELRDILRSRAAHRRAESARDEEAERLAEVYRVAFKAASAGNAPNSWAVAGVRAVLDRLAADGRLLPEGGTVLTEEQVANLRWLMAQYVGFDGDIDCPPYASLDALFTPPAVSVPDSGPDGAPEKPWPTWQDVPDDVKYQSANSLGPAYVNHNGEPFVILGGIATRVAQWCAMDSAAPFVRVDGDKA